MWLPTPNPKEIGYYSAEINILSNLGWPDQAMKRKLQRISTPLSWASLAICYGLLRPPRRKNDTAVAD